VLMILVAMLLELLHLDDVVGAVSVHAVGGAWGTLAAGLFYAGDMFNINKIYVQLLGIFAAFIWAMLAALIMYFMIKKLMGLRASTMDEQRGLDYTEHAEVGYPEFQKEVMHQAQGDR
ncbi:MAG: ammonium transporter, partial [Sulfuriferula sp.]